MLSGSAFGSLPSLALFGSLFVVSIFDSRQRWICNVYLKKWEWLPRQVPSHSIQWFNVLRSVLDFKSRLRRGRPHQGLFETFPSQNLSSSGRFILLEPLVCSYFHFAWGQGLERRTNSIPLRILDPWFQRLGYSPYHRAKLGA